jgi:hypothetical protein
VHEQMSPMVIVPLLAAAPAVALGSTAVAAKTSAAAHVLKATARKRPTVPPLNPAFARCCKRNTTVTLFESRRLIIAHPLIGTPVQRTVRKKVRRSPLNSSGCSMAAK